MSASEALLEIQLKASRIKYQREVYAIPNRKFRFDFHCGNNVWKGGILVEVQGGVWLKGKSAHSSGKGLTRDAEKLSLAAVNGYRVIVCTPAQIKSGKAIEWIKKALA